MLTLDQIMAIVSDSEVAEMKQAAVYFSLLVLVACPVLVYGLRKLFKAGLALVALFGCFLFAIANKPPVVAPQVTWDSGLYDAGSSFDTNSWKTIHFRWNHSATIAATEPVYFAAKHKDHPELEYDEIGQSTSGLRAWDYTFAGEENATNYVYYVFTIGEVHTNGVWIGNILQKVSPGTCGPDKMVIIRSKLEVNGRQIAPFKE